MKTHDKAEELLKETVSDLKELVLHNDDYNTFEHVIDSLVKVCDHDLIQAEQCAYVVHFNGKCTVKRDEPKKIVSMYEKLRNRSLTVEIKG